MSVFMTRRRQVRSPTERPHHRGATQIAVAIKHTGELTLLQARRASARETPGAACLSTPRQFGLCTNRAFQSPRNPSGALRRKKCARRRMKPGHEVPAAMDGSRLTAAGAMDGTEDRETRMRAEGMNGCLPNNVPIQGTRCAPSDEQSSRGPRLRSSPRFPAAPDGDRKQRKSKGVATVT